MKHFLWSRILSAVKHLRSLSFGFDESIIDQQNVQSKSPNPDLIIEENFKLNGQWGCDTPCLCMVIHLAVF